VAWVTPGGAISAGGELVAPIGVPDAAGPIPGTSGVIPGLLAAEDVAETAGAGLAAGDEAAAGGGGAAAIAAPLVGAGAGIPVATGGGTVAAGAACPAEGEVAAGLLATAGSGARDRSGPPKVRGPSVVSRTRPAARPKAAIEPASQRPRPRRPRAGPAARGCADSRARTIGVPAGGAAAAGFLEVVAVVGLVGGAPAPAGFRKIGVVAVLASGWTRRGVSASAGGAAIVTVLSLAAAPPAGPVIAAASTVTLSGAPRWFARFTSWSAAVAGAYRLAYSPISASLTTPVRPSEQRSRTSPACT